MNAATALFGDRGVRRARMDEIARAAGVSPGNVYNYVTGKHVLFRLVLERALEPGWQPPDASSPLDAPPLDETAQWVTARMDIAAEFPRMEAALKRRRPPRDVAGETEEVIGELFDVMLRIRHATLIVERSMPDMPELAERFLAIRREMFARMTRFIERRVRAGAFRPLVSPAATARLIVEATAWTTRGRLADPDPKTALSDEAARQALVELALRTLVGAEEEHDAHPLRTTR